MDLYTVMTIRRLLVLYQMEEGTALFSIKSFDHLTCAQYNIFIQSIYGTSPYDFFRHKTLIPIGIPVCSDCCLLLEYLWGIKKEAPNTQSWKIKVFVVHNCHIPFTIGTHLESFKIRFWWPWKWWPWKAVCLKERWVCGKVFLTVSHQEIHFAIDADLETCLLLLHMLLHFVLTNLYM